MALEFTDANGQRHILEGQKWRPATEREVQILDEGGVESAVQAGKVSSEQIGGFGQVLASFLSSPPRGQRTSGEAFQAAQESVREQGMQRLSDTAQELEQRHALNPLSTTAGQIGLDVIAEVLPGGVIAQQIAKRGGRAAARQAAQESVEETAERIGRDAGGLAPQRAPQSTGGVSDAQAEGLGEIVDSAGAMSRAGRSGLWSALKRMPKFKGLLEKLQDFATTPRPLKGDQAELLASGNAERLGFEFLPGQREGNDMVSELIKSDPFLADAFDPVVSANAKNLETRVSKALGLPGDQFGRNSFNQADEILGDRFSEVASQVNAGTIPEELQTLLDSPDILTAQDKRLFNIGDADHVTSGEDLMELRSKLNDAYASKRQDAAEGVAARHIFETLDQVDDLIGQRIKGGKQGDAWAQWKDTQQRWRVNLAFQKPGVVLPDGSISIKRLATSLDKGFERDFKKHLFQRGEDGAVRNPNMPEDIADLLDYTRLARGFESNLGDSGTASRLMLQQLIKGGPSAFIKKRTAAKFITDVLLDRPIAAEALPGG